MSILTVLIVAVVIWVICAQVLANNWNKAQRQKKEARQLERAEEERLSSEPLRRCSQSSRNNSFVGWRLSFPTQSWVRRPSCIGS